MESLSRITHETPEQTSLRDRLVASSQEWMKRLAPIVKEVTGHDDVDTFLKEKPVCPPDVIQRMIPIVKALNEIAVLMNEVASGKTPQDLKAIHGDAYREHLLGPDTKEKILNKNLAWQKEFFGRTYEMPPIPECATPERIKRWEELRFELRYLPPERMTKDRKFRGWKKRPDESDGAPLKLFRQAQFLQDDSENQSNPNLQGLSPLDLPGRWVLIDTRPKPDLYLDKTTRKPVLEYEDDFDIEQVIHGGRNSVHSSEFSKPEFWTGMKKLLQVHNVPSAIVRLPRVIEQSVLGQGPEWDRTTGDEWSEEKLGGDRLTCGDSRWGGVSQISLSVDSTSTGFRPMVVFN